MSTPASVMTMACVGLLQLSLAFAALSSRSHSATWFHATLLPLGLNVGTAAIPATTSIPLITLPNTTFSPSREGTSAGPVVMRNWVPADLNPPASKQEDFEKKFGISWKAALAKGIVYNAVDGCKQLGIDGTQMDKQWAAAKKAGNLVKFGGGFYAGKVEPPK